VVFVRPAVVVCGYEASSTRPVPALILLLIIIIIITITITWRQQAYINEGELITGLQKDSGINLL